MFGVWAGAELVLATLTFRSSTLSVSTAAQCQSADGQVAAAQLGVWEPERVLDAERVDRPGRLDRLEAFAALRGADFYGLPRNTARITLERSQWTPPATYSFAAEELVPFRAGEPVAWRLTEESTH